VQQMHPTSLSKDVVVEQVFSRLLVTFRKTLPRLQEQPPGASGGAGKKGKSLDEPGQYWRYLTTSSWYWHEYTCIST